MPLYRAYRKPAALSAAQPVATTARKTRSDLIIALILALTFPAARFSAPLAAQDAPPNLAKLVAHRETETEAERDEYTYRQTMTLDELDDHGSVQGYYREVRDIVFSPTHERSEEFVEKPRNGLKRIQLTDEDFRDLRDIQPLVLTEDRLWNYETKFRGDDMDDIDCWVLQVRPRQILEGQRFFDGLVWVDKKEYNIVRMAGQAVPQIRTTKSENLFPDSPPFVAD